MKYYKLIALSVGAKGNRTLYKEDNKTYPENTWPEKIADELVAQKFLINVKEDPIKEDPKIKSEPEKEKPEDKKEPSILDSMEEAGDSKKDLYEEAKKLAEEKGIKPPHRLLGIEKLKIFIKENAVEHTEEDNPEVPKDDSKEIDKEPSILDSIKEGGDGLSENEALEDKGDNSKEE